MKLYDFARLISKYSVEFELHQETEGKFVSGKWEKGEPLITKMNGAIVPMTDRKIYDSGGSYTTKDRELYVTVPFTGSLSECRVHYKGNIYSVEESKNFEDYADVVVYTLKWVSKA